VRIAFAEGVIPQERGVALRVVHAVDESRLDRRERIEVIREARAEKPRWDRLMTLCERVVWSSMYEGDSELVTCDDCIAKLVARAGE
jgi:hypothetical protein